MPYGYDLVIKNARIVDGTGGPWRRGDVALKDGRISFIGKVDSALAGESIDACDRVLAPGFIDIHTHADREAVKLHLMENYLQQGVTTLLGGNCGFSMFPIAEHLKEMSDLPLTINYGLFVGHGSLREAAMGLGMRPPSSLELIEMTRLAGQAMQDGAFGMSIGLYYAPGSFAELREVVTVAREIGKHGGIITIHLRDESNYNIGLVEAVNEAINIAREARVPVQISHLKCLGRPVWGKSQEILSIIADARAQGLDVAFDQYPYEASGTAITGAIIPRWAQDGGDDELAGRLRDPEMRQRIRAEMLENIERRGGPASLVIALYPPDPKLNGKNLAEAGLVHGMEPVDAAIEMQIKGGASLVSFNMIDDDINTIMCHPTGMFVSDGSLVPYGEGVPHPRYYGTFPRVLGRYVREKQILSLEEAIRKMTSAPAGRVGLTDRGVIATGMVADLVLFDPETIADLSTFDAPHNYNSGIDLVIVNGKIAMNASGMTENRAGRVLRKPI